jgi:short-subunit dehydrogenase
MMSFDWSQKVVFITGASSGIGRALAVELGKRGAMLGLLARRAEALGELVAEVERSGGQAVALPADVRDAAAVRAAADELRARFNRIDVLIANAGIATTAHITEVRAEDVAEVMSINVVGAANSVGAVLPEMVARGSGQLVAISSLSAYRGLPKSAVYCASKAALSAFFESVRVDLRGTGVDVTIIHPGFIKTPLTAGRKAVMPYLMELDDATKKIVRAIEARRKSCAFPWQLATVVRAAMLFPIPLYDRMVSKRSYRE